MSYRDTTLALAERSEADVSRAWDAFEHDRLSAVDLTAVVVSTVTRWNARAVAVADLSLAATLSVARRQAVPVLGLLPAADDGPRLVKAVTTILSYGRELPRGPEHAQATAARAARLARAEPLAAGQDAYRRGMERRGIPGWTRGTAASPCPMCIGLADGTVLPPSTPMSTHPGCSCFMIPVL